MATSRKPTAYVTFTITGDRPIHPEVIQRMLDVIPFYSDIVEMRITEDDGPILKRHVTVTYATVMPWEAQ